MTEAQLLWKNTGSFSWCEIDQLLP